MLRLAFILSLWPSLLSAAGFSGQLVYAMRGISPPAASAGYYTSGADDVLRMSVLAFLFFFLPVIVSLALAAVHGLTKKSYGGLFIATIALNVFSLLYGLILYGAVASAI